MHNEPRLGIKSLEVKYLQTADGRKPDRPNLLVLLQNLERDQKTLIQNQENHFSQIVNSIETSRTRFWILAGGIGVGVLIQLAMAIF